MEISQRSVQDLVRLHSEIEELLQRVAPTVAAPTTPRPVPPEVAVRRHRHDWVTVFAVLALAAGLVNLGQTILVASKYPRTLLTYREQVVESRVTGQQGPAATAGTITVTGRKCNTGDEPLALHFTTSWVSADPAGSSIPGFAGSFIKTPGCTTRTFENRLPAAVLNRTRELCTEGRTWVSWRLTGREVPINARVAAGVWQTEPFKVYCEGLPGVPS